MQIKKKKGWLDGHNMWHAWEVLKVFCQENLNERDYWEERCRLTMILHIIGTLIPNNVRREYITKLRKDFDSRVAVFTLQWYSLNFSGIHPVSLLHKS
jgi:hypothetical protein